MPKHQVTEILHNLISDVVFAQRESVMMTASWVASEALRQLRTAQERAQALREGAEAIARDALMNSNPPRMRVSRHAEFQFVTLDHLTDGELVDLLSHVRFESLASAEAALDLQQKLSLRMAGPPAMQEVLQ